MSTSTRIKRVIPVALYTVFYLLWFSYLENRHVRYHIIDSSLDDKIPFCEYFIIPYLLWFLYIAVTVGYFLFFNENTTEFWSLILNLAIGMTLFLIVSYVYPNGLNIRPAEFTNDSVFTRMVQFLYRTDTPTNVLPSIHVYNSVAAFSAIHTCKNLQKHKGIRTGSFILTTLIILSTMFLKQHSIADVATGITCAVATYVLFYSRAAEKQGAKAKQRSPLHQHDTHM
ncbi:MAG: phosphoesterase [Lachnospiraceae bacterium]